MKIFCIYYRGMVIIKNQTLERCLELLERSSNLTIGIQINNN
jgi:hypothetical protein